MKKVTTRAVTSLLTGGLAGAACALGQTVPGAGQMPAAELAPSPALDFGGHVVRAPVAGPWTHGILR